MLGSGSAATLLDAGELQYHAQIGFDLSLAHIEHVAWVEPGAGEQRLRLADRF